uniref:branched-chain amino acid ABC transporter permease n=1 Tax=Achromobacter animicus TaxID=1389935 RepID=UPI0028B03240
MNKQSAMRWLPPALYALLAVAALILAATVNGYYVFVLGNVALLALAGIGLNVLLGLTGQMSFGHAGFYAIGAYTVAILTGQAEWSFWLAWPAAALVCGAFGLLLAVPALRVKGPYLAMITIAFGFIVEHALIEGGSVTGGQNGLMGIVQPALGSLGGDRGVAMLAIVAVFAALIGYALLSRGAWGAAMRAVKDSETASESIGINPLVVKAVAFMVSAAVVGLAGGLYAPLTGMITPHNFNFMQSILFVLAVTIGGAGSLAGPLLGAVVVGLLPEVLSSLEEYRLLFFGAFLLVVLWAAPEGAAGLLARWRRRAQTQGFAPRHGALPA